MRIWRWEAQTALSRSFVEEMERKLGKDMRPRRVLVPMALSEEGMTGGRERRAVSCIMFLKPTGTGSSPQVKGLVAEKINVNNGKAGRILRHKQANG